MPLQIGLQSNQQPIFVAMNTVFGEKQTRNSQDIPTNALSLNTIMTLRVRAG